MWKAEKLFKLFFGSAHSGQCQREAHRNVCTGAGPERLCGGWAAVLAPAWGRRGGRAKVWLDEKSCRLVAQAASSTYETALRASVVDGVVTCLSSQQRRKTLFRSVPLPLVFSLDGALRQTAWLADRAYGAVTTRMVLSVRRDHQARAVRQLQQVYGRTVECVWTALTEPRCSNRHLRRFGR